MNVSTSRFGNVEIEDDRVITFPAGLLGFADCRQFALIQPNPDGAFYWLQSVERPELAFVVTDPGLFVSNYEVPLRPEQMDAIELESIEDAQVLVIANRYGEFITGNLQGPLVVNVKSRLAQQLVLADQRWATRHKLIATAGANRSGPVAASAHDVDAPEGLGASPGAGDLEIGSAMLPRRAASA